MFVKYTYQVQSSLLLTEHWPISWGPYQLEWQVKEGRAEAVSVRVKAPASSLPRITRNPQPGVTAAINLGSPPYRAEVDQFLRSFRGLLGFFTRIEIDFDHPQLNWEAENDDEKAQLALYSFSSQMAKPDRFALRHLPFDLVVRSVLATEAIADIEIPLSFVRKADRDLHNERYIEAFYSLFFFLETLYAPGYSNPKQVAKRFESSKPILDAIAHVRRSAKATTERGIKRFQNSDSTEIISYFVKLRGSLHHHSQANQWHPDKQRIYKDEVWFLREVVQKIAMDKIMPILFSDKWQSAAMKSAEKAGAIQKFRLVPLGIKDRQATMLEPLFYNVPGRRPSHDLIRGVEKDFRSRAPQLFPQTEIIAYRIYSDASPVILANYCARNARSWTHNA